MNFDYYKVFYIVGKHKNITRASKELFTSQPAVTRTIKNLESELGCKLFFRTKSGVEFTEEGKKLFNFVESSYVQLSKGVDEIINSISISRGTLRIGTTSTALEGFLYKFLVKFNNMYPNINYSIITSSNDGIIKRLNNETIDVAIITTPFHSTANFKKMKITDLKTVVVGGSKYKELSGKISIKDLENYPFINLTKNMQLREYIDNLFIKEDMNITPILETEQIHMISKLVQENFGLAILPLVTVEEELKKQKLFEIETGYDFPQREIDVIANVESRQSLVTKEFIKSIKGTLK
ncbi:MAG: LysR family transcriptional regulator [Gammaproteobacteria bacterium]|nr:LysR family transcriptional regulator [Gammaproteobacteria bacterium]